MSKTNLNTTHGTDLVDIDTIKRNIDFLMRDGIDKSVVAAYKENLEKIVELNPIVVYDTPNGLMLADGFHRLAAARQLNWEKIRTEIRKGSIQECYAYACIANLKHGKPLKPKERKKAISEYIKLKVGLSNVEISNRVGVSDESIRLYRIELESKGEIPKQKTRLGHDGRLINVSEIGMTSKNSEVTQIDPFTAWFDSHVVNDDMFTVLADDSLKYDLIIVDPPYGITEESWDKQTKFDLLVFTRRWLNLVLQKLKPTGRLYVFWSRKYMFDLKPLFDEIQNEYPLNFGGIIVWNFRNTFSVPNNRKEFKLTWEPIFYFYGSHAPELNRPNTELSGEKWDAMVDSDVWAFAVPQSNFKDKKVHPAQKPLELYKHIITVSTKPNDLILDPFAGSGTTGHAAHTLGREFRLIEKNTEYCETIRERLSEVFHNGN